MKTTTRLVLVSDVTEYAVADVDLEGLQITTRSEVEDLGLDDSGWLVRVPVLPPWLMWVVVTLIRLFDRRQEELLSFPEPVAAVDAQAPQCGPYASLPHIPRLWGER